MKQNIKLNVTYDGSNYNGFQRLVNNKNTIQEKIETCISRYLNEEIQVVGSSRTDAGVHAQAQIVNFYTTKVIDELELLKDINYYLPKDIAVTKVEKVSERFHSRFWSVEKTYRYRILTGIVPNVFERQYIFHLGKTCDIERMRQASTYLIGEHDFQGFTARKTKKNTVRNVKEISIRQIGDEIIIDITANGFLYNMVRIIVGTLIEVGIQQREMESIKDILYNQTRQEAGFLAPASGLMLIKNVIEERES